MLDGNRDHYFSVRRSAQHCIDVSMFAAGVKTVRNTLGLPFGYDRVLRHLQGAYPGAQLTEGVAFCAASFGAKPVYGHKSPHGILLEGKYDLIWVGSLLARLNCFLQARCRTANEVRRRNLAEGHSVASRQPLQNSKVCQMYQTTTTGRSRMNSSWTLAYKPCANLQFLAGCFGNHRRHGSLRCL